MYELPADLPVRPTYAFGDLILRPEGELTDDERASLTYFLAYDDVILGYSPNNAPRRWAEMSMRVARLAHALNRLPTTSDAVAGPAELSWIAQQQRATYLNPFQRARLREIVGWPYGVVETPPPPPACAELTHQTEPDPCLVSDYSVIDWERP